MTNVRPRSNDIAATAAACVSLTLAVGCSAGSTPAGGARPEPTAAATPATVLPGHWVGADGTSSETWVRVDAPLVGVAFSTRDGATTAFEVMIVHVRDGGAVLTAMPGGRSQVDFTAAAPAEAGELLFENAAHDDPKQLRYRRSGDTLHVAVDGDRGVRTTELRLATAAPAAELEELDIAFATDSAERAGDAWGDRFTPDGATWPLGVSRTEGPEQIAQRIDQMRDAGLVLRWAPVASGASPAGDAGFTAGTYWIDRADGEVDGGTGVYVSVWRRDAPGAWKIAFDTGVAAQR